MYLFIGCFETYSLGLMYIIEMFVSRFPEERPCVLLYFHCIAVISKRLSNYLRDWMVQSSEKNISLGT